MIIECLIDRKGDTSFQKDGIPYVFKHNEHGASVCNVTSDQHITDFLKTPWYRVYERPVEAAAVNAIGHGLIELEEEDDDMAVDTAEAVVEVETDIRVELEGKLSDCRARLLKAHGRQRTPIKAEIASLEEQLKQFIDEAA